jgi:hypothetical protein
MIRRLACVGVAVLVLSAAAAAHHSFGAVYLESDSIEVDGQIVEFQ